MNIQNIIAKGENKNTEFKSQTPSSNKIAKTLIAFANGSGGKLIIGVSDSGDIIGFKGDLPSEMDKISNIVHDLIHPSLLPEVYSYNVDGKILLVIEVFPSQIKPHYIKSTLIMEWQGTSNLIVQIMCCFGRFFLIICPF